MALPRLFTSLREFPRRDLLDEAIPEHASLSRICFRLLLEAHNGIFTLVLGIPVKGELAKGAHIDVDGSNMEAIVRRGVGVGCQGFFMCTTKESGVEMPTPIRASSSQSARV